MTHTLDVADMLPAVSDASAWKRYYFTLRNSSTSMLNKSLPFADFVQALLLVAVKKYSDLKAYSREKRCELPLATPIPAPSRAGAVALSPSHASNCLHRVMSGEHCVMQRVAAFVCRCVVRVPV